MRFYARIPLVSCSQTALLRHLTEPSICKRASRSAYFCGLHCYQFFLLGPREKDGSQIPAVLPEALGCWLLSPAGGTRTGLSDCESQPTRPPLSRQAFQTPWAAGAPQRGAGRGVLGPEAQPCSRPVLIAGEDCAGLWSIFTQKDVCRYVYLWFPSS